MDLVDGLKVFVATAQTGSFTAAANQLGISNRLTSKYVAELETRLGARLFQRTTRRVGLTPAGNDLLERVPALLDELDEVLSDIAESSRGFTGMIRVSAPVTLGEMYIASMLGRFTGRHPELTVDLRLEDDYVDLASQGIDVAFRIGNSQRLTVKTRKLGNMQSLVVASPGYLARVSAPKSPADLASHRCILDSNHHNPKQWVLLKSGSKEVVDVDGHILANSARAVADLAAAGNGIAYSPKFAIFDHLEDGRLISLLDGYTGTSSPVSAVYLEGRRLPRKVRTLIDFASADIKAANIV